MKNERITLRSMSTLEIDDMKKFSEVLMIKKFLRDAVGVHVQVLLLQQIIQVQML